MLVLDIFSGLLNAVLSWVDATHITPTRMSEVIPSQVPPPVEARSIPDNIFPDKEP